MPEYGINNTTLNLEHIVLKANNASAWPADYVLLAGELGFELDTKKYKLGDGTTAWSELAYYTNPAADSIVDTLTGRVDAIDGTNGRLATIEAKDSAQDSRLDALDGADGEIAGLKAKDSAQDGRLDTLEAITTISANPFRS